MTDIGSAQNKKLYRNYSVKKHPDWKKMKNNMKPEAKEDHKQSIDVMKSQDYLRMQRVKREDDERHGIKRKLIDDRVWEKYMKDENITDYEKLEEIKRRAQWMEQRAEMDEKLLRNNVRDGDHFDSVEKTIAVNDMYLEAIQAKLKLLDDI